MADHPSMSGACLAKLPPASASTTPAGVVFWVAAPSARSINPVPSPLPREALSVRYAPWRGGHEASPMGLSGGGPTGQDESGDHPFGSTTKPP